MLVLSCCECVTGREVGGDWRRREEIWCHIIVNTQPSVTPASNTCLPSVWQSVLSSLIAAVIFHLPSSQTQHPNPSFVFRSMVCIMSLKSPYDVVECFLKSVRCDFLSSYLGCPQWMCQVQLRPGRGPVAQHRLPWPPAQIVAEINWEIWIRGAADVNPSRLLGTNIDVFWANIPLWCNVRFECPAEMTMIVML